MMIYHITTRSDWEKAVEQGLYRAASLESEGFIHCSTRDQVARSAANYFKGQTDLRLLTIDPTRLTPQLIMENTTGGTEPFPHVYGPLNLDAVLEAKPFQCP